MRFKAFGGTLVLAALVAACGSSSGNGSNAGGSTTPSSPPTTASPTTTTTPPQPDATVQTSLEGGGTVQGEITMGAAIPMSNQSDIDANSMNCYAQPINPATTVVAPATEVTTLHASLQAQLNVLVAPVNNNAEHVIVIGDLNGSPTCMQLDNEQYTRAVQTVQPNGTATLKMWFVYIGALTSNAPSVAANAAALGQTIFAVSFSIPGQLGGTGNGSTWGPRVVTCGTTGGGTSAVTGLVPVGTLPAQLTNGNGSAIPCSPIPTSNS